jgi:ribose transport system permease protein
VTEWFARRGLQIVSSYGLLVLLALLFAAFSIARPDTFPTAYNLQSIASSKAIVGLAALAVMIPLAAGQFDLSVGYLIGLAEVLTIGLQTKSHLPAGVAILVVLAFGALVGLVNGTVVTRLHVNSFITTLGVGTILSGVDNWYTNGATIQGNLPSGFTDISGNLHGFPYAALFVIAVSFVLWVFLEYRPVGRRLYVIGASPRAAELTGIPIARYVTASFIASGVLAASGGVVLSSSLRVGQPGIGPEYLLPAFAGALLGSTTIRPGRVNVWGTIAAVVTLAVAVSGLELLGAQFYVEDIFNGAILIVAVALAVSAERRRRLGRDGASVSIADSDGSDEPNPPTGAASVQGPAD